MDPDFFPPEHLPADERTLAIATKAAGSVAISFADVQTALLVELAGTLHDAGLLPAGSVATLAARWSSVLSGWKHAPGMQPGLGIMSAELAAEMAWRFPSLLPRTPNAPTRVGRKRWPEASPSAQ